MSFSFFLLVIIIILSVLFTQVKGLQMRIRQEKIIQIYQIHTELDIYIIRQSDIFIAQDIYFVSLYYYFFTLLASHVVRFNK